MTAVERALVQIAVCIGADDHSGLREAFGAEALRDHGVLVEEVILQSYLFVGYPRTLNAFQMWREISGLPAPVSTSAAWTDWERRGRQVLASVYGGETVPSLLENVRALHPDLEVGMVADGYGRILGRPALSLPLRELCIVALLGTQNSLPQLYSHMRGALRVGASAQAVEETLGLALGYDQVSWRAEAEEAWAAVKSRQGV